MNFYSQKPPDSAVPPLVSKETKKKISRGVWAAHLLLVGVPLAIMTLFAWLSPEPEKLMIIELVEEKEFNPPPPGEEDPSPSEVAPEPPAEIPPVPPISPPPEALPPPPPPSPLDTALPPKEDPIPLPKPPKEKPPKEKPPKEKPPKPPKESPPKPPKDPPRVQPNLRAIDPKTLPPKNAGGKNNTGVEHDPNKPVGGNPNATAGYDAKLAIFVRIQWDELIPSENQLSGRKPKVAIILTIGADGFIKSATVKQRSGIAAMDNAVRELCEKLRRAKAPRTGNSGDVVKEIILECK